MPSKLKSVVARNSCPGGRRRTAQSSPMPARTARFDLRVRPWGEDSAMRRIWAISAFSGSGTTHLLYRLGRVVPPLDADAKSKEVFGELAKRPTDRRMAMGRILPGRVKRARTRLSHRASVTLLREPWLAWCGCA